jgi:hypothetical protein
MSERLPTSKPLGPVACREVRFTGHCGKGNERAVGALNSAIRASRPDILPLAVREDQVVEREASLHAAQELNDFLQGGHGAEGLDTVWSLDPEQGEVVVDALTLCEEQSADALAAEGATDVLEDDLLENGGFHIVKIIPIAYRRSTNIAAADLRE